MKLDVKQNAKKGIAFGLLNRMLATILPFFVQTVFIRQLGIEYVGVRGLFTSILTIFSLAELGAGSAIVFSMYKPIAEENTKELSALLNLYRKLYRMIGFIIFVLSILILPFLPHLVRGSYPSNINIYIVFLLYSAQTVLSYGMYAYKSSLLQAYQRTDIISIVGILITILTCVFQIGVLLLLKSFYGYLFIGLFAVLINNFLISAAVDRMYPEVKCYGYVTHKKLKILRKQVVGVFIGKICGVTRNSFDSIFISVFLGLTQAGVYSNYFYVLAALNSFTSIITTSLLAGIGNKIALGSKESNYMEMMQINNVYLVIGGWMAICMLCIVQPFMELWAGKQNLFPEHIIVLFPIYFYIQKMGDVRGVYSDAAGLFWENRGRTIAEAVANIVLNYFFIQWFGVFGIILSTVLTLFFIGFLGSTQVLFKYYFKSGMKEYILQEGKYMAIAVVVGGVTYSLCGNIVTESTLTSLLLRSLICATLVPLMYWLLLHRSKEYENNKKWIIRLMHR